MAMFSTDWLLTHATTSKGGKELQLKPELTFKTVTTTQAKLSRFNRA